MKDKKIAKISIETLTETVDFIQLFARFLNLDNWLKNTTIKTT